MRAHYIAPHGTAPPRQLVPFRSRGFTAARLPSNDILPCSLGRCGRPARALSRLVRSAQQAKRKRCRCVLAQPRLPELRQWPGRLRLWLGAWCVAPLPNRQRNLSAAPIELSLAAPVCQSSVGCLNGVFFTIRCKGNRAAERRGDQARAGRHTIVRPKSAVLHWADCNP